jgi:hypothetical protein
MTKLLRPYIPLKTRCRVAARQLAGVIGLAVVYTDAKAAKQLKELLHVLAETLKCKSADLQLDHNPALENRAFNSVTKKYLPEANDPDYLIYRERHAHKIKTLVRGDGAQLSDAAIARKRKRKERKHLRRKTKWPKQKLRSANRWPAKRFVERRWPGYRIEKPKRRKS